MGCFTHECLVIWSREKSWRGFYVNENSWGVTCSWVTLLLWSFGLEQLTKGVTFNCCVYCLYLSFSLAEPIEYIPRSKGLGLGAERRPPTDEKRRKRKPGDSSSKNVGQLYILVQEMLRVNEGWSPKPTTYIKVPLFFWKQKEPNRRNKLKEPNNQGARSPVLV